MNKLNLANVRMILDSYSRMSPIPSQLGLSFGLACSVKEGYSASYSITEERYEVKERHKIGFCGNPYLGVPSETFYQSDLRHLIENSENPHAGFYKITESDVFGIGDLANVNITEKGKTVFDMPLLIVGQSASHFYLKSAVELFEEPKKKGLWDFITGNKYWDCAKVPKDQLTHKYIKLNVNDVLPDYEDEDLASA